MWEFWAAVAGCLGAGLASAVFPLVNAELATVAAAGLAARTTAWACVAAVAVGQTIGKIVIYESARAGRALHQRRRGGSGPVDSPPAVTAVGSTVDDPTPSPCADPSPVVHDSTSPSAPIPAPTVAMVASTCWSRLKAWLGRVSRRLEAAMDTRWRRVAVMLVSSSVGVPPLLAMAALAGVLRMRRFDYVVCVLVGRLLRFGAIAWPVLVLTG
ncbi:MAG: hypothetical protein LBJ44_00680 [Propionibacteriaceae bacterium]|jgi:membrane protein YqaA with SNARE-associated domain|nr:hypothetical protein [Propionibacteriaceae bacterium]